VRMDLKRSVLAVLTLVFALGIGIRLCEIPVAAQESKVAHDGAGQSVTQEELEIDENAAYRESPMVQKMGWMIGLNPKQSSIAFEVTNFVLLALLVGWGMAKMLPKLLRDRTSTIQKSLVDARTATEEARVRLSGVEERLSKLDGEIAAMRTHAEQASIADEQRIKTSVEDEKKKILAAAEQEIAAATMHAQKQLQQHAAELAIEQAARKLVVSAETDRLLVQGFAQRLAGDESKKGQN
jgi:F-type H+-transporting ATPase subunit b